MSGAVQGSKPFSHLIRCTLWLCLLLPVGCSKTSVREGYAPAYGTVTLDDKPLANAAITFKSDTGKAYGRTDKSGKYEMEYSRSLTGAPLGTAKVEITTKTAFADEDTANMKYDPTTDSHVKEELVPDKYNRKSELTVEVTADGAPYDFKLSSK